MPTSRNSLQNLPSALDTMGHEQVTVCRDPSTGYVGILAVYDTVRRVFEVARRLGVGTHRAADRMVEDRLSGASTSTAPEPS